MSSLTMPIAARGTGQIKDVKKEIVLYAPASLLLCGEYFVTEIGGQGLCLAVEPRAVCRIVWHGTGHAVRLITRFANEECVFENAQDNKLYKYCEACSAPYLALYKKRCAVPKDAKVSISIDTQAFYAHAHETEARSYKRGFGSSEAAAVLICAALCLLEGKEPLSNRHVLATHTAHAHYAWQGNKGSGYGAWTSVFGGLGLYTNYALHESTMPFFANKWQVIPPVVYAYLCWCFQNCGNAQSSRSAMQYYTAWKVKHAHAFADFVARYKRFFQEFFTSIMARPVLDNDDAIHSCAKDIVQSLNEARVLGEWIGDKIGVSARLGDGAETVRAMRAYKAVGAGRECVVGLAYAHECETVGATSCLNVSLGIGYGA